MKDKERELYDKVNIWVERSFNFIDREVYELVLGDQILQDYIEPLSICFDDFFSDYNKWNEYKEWYKEQGYDLEDSGSKDVKEEYCLQDIDYDTYVSEKEADNFPMWNVVFEIRNRWGSLEEKAKEVGLGIIEETNYFNTTLFMMSAGHSFYSSYWIPLYLLLYPKERELYKDVDYSHL